MTQPTLTIPHFPGHGQSGPISHAGPTGGGTFAPTDALPCGLSALRLIRDAAGVGASSVTVEMRHTRAVVAYGKAAHDLTLAQARVLMEQAFRLAETEPDCPSAPETPAAARWRHERALARNTERRPHVLRYP